MHELADAKGRITASSHGILHTTEHTDSKDAKAT